MIGRWVAARDQNMGALTCVEALRHIERAFDRAVRQVLEPLKLSNLRVVVLMGDEHLHPALAILCDDVGQVDLGWIEKTNVLSDALAGPVAPVGWRAAAYQALEGTLGSVLKLFNYADMLEEFSMHYWEGATTDEEALAYLVDCLGVEADEAEAMLPSTMNAKRPDYMTAQPEALKRMPKGLADRLRRLRAAFDAHRAARTAWLVEDFHRSTEYFPELEEASHLPPLTLVPHDQFARELDEIGRHGMEMGFTNVAGLLELPDADGIEGWFASFRLGIDVLLAAQDLINFDPMQREGHA
ncbi:hypothetical protein J2Y54_000567 [Sphingomonas sp. BE123]|uniref:hypothetical protein n=1 Tax=Sphingomonas sp. BE123 TaxID=2817842 RepID=UPI0028553D04|nr:hypothetical protein [Sphingomonas sp. BE123]MDR6851074.1 hypothetical protein [Sphingomonas sp. BE123]